jgi:hypothetical protein
MTMSNEEIVMKTFKEAGIALSAGMLQKFQAWIKKKWTKS